mmetsp:Transcript_114909/g.329961  ORF Transcript_114909/g.329961 Transcript_114909/m.329961 type:complete len:203 (+) Transcript_114909:1181-1789(+)
MRRSVTTTAYSMELRSRWKIMFAAARRTMPSATDKPTTERAVGGKVSSICSSVTTENRSRTSGTMRINTNKKPPNAAGTESAPQRRGGISLQAARMRSACLCSLLLSSSMSVMPMHRTGTLTWYFVKVPSIRRESREVRMNCSQFWETVSLTKLLTPAWSATSLLASLSGASSSLAWLLLFPNMLPNSPRWVPSFGCTITDW